MRRAAIPAMIIVALIAAKTADAASTECPKHFLAGQAPDVTAPKMREKARPICFSEYAVLHSGLTRTPLYSADHLTRERIVAAKRQRRADAADSFHEEEAVPENERSRLTDYARSGFDRGHVVPNADMPNANAQGESFSLANMIPQDPDNNRNLWSDIEEKTRELALDQGEAWVVTVPIFAGGKTRWLRDRVAIPETIAKAIHVPGLGAAAYLVRNAPGTEWKAISIAELRERSGIDPFPGLSENIKKIAIELPDPTIRKRRKER
jgi:endonuclease G